MSNVVAIFRRELTGYFGNPLAYIVLSLFLVLLALPTLWFRDIMLTGEASMSDAFRWISAGFLFFVPAITMRLVAEERSSNTMEILGTLPVSSTQVVVGKWLSAVALVWLALAFTITWPTALFKLGDLDWGPVVGGYLGLGLIGAAFAAIGVAASALTRYQILAFLLSFVVCLLPWALGFLLDALPPELEASIVWIQYLTIEYHFANLARGVLDTRSVVFFAAVTLVALRVAVQGIEHRRLA